MSFPPKFRNYLLAQKGQPVSVEQLEQVADQRKSYFQRQQSPASSSSTAWSEQKETEIVDYLLPLLSIIAAFSESQLDERLERPLVALLRCYEEFLHSGKKDWLQSREEAFQHWIADKLGWVCDSQQAQNFLSLLDSLASDTKTLLIFRRGEEKCLSRQLERCFHRACQRRRWENYVKSSNNEFLQLDQPKIPVATDEWLSCYPEWNSEFEQEILQKLEKIRKQVNKEENVSPIQEIYDRCRECFRQMYSLNEQQQQKNVSLEEEEQKVLDDCMQSIFGVLTTSQSSEQLQEQLFDLVGDFELVSELLQRREELIRVYYPKEEDEYIQSASSLAESSNATNASSIRTQSMLSEQLEALSLQGENGYYANEPFLKMSLPKGSTRQSYVGYEEYWIPPTNNRIPDENHLLRISQEVDSCFLPVFKDITFLNPIQSKVFHTAYHTNENLLICAPTGAGKTNVALLTVLHVLKDKLIHHQVTDGPRIVYIAPMKALASEVTENFRRRLKCLEVVVEEMTGDMQLSYQEAKKTDMIVTTPEKWDIVTRKGTDSSDDSSLHANLQLLIIDEIHLLHELRGVILEAVIARTLKMVERNQRMIRLVGLSATLPNYEDIAEFLRVNRDQGLYYFDASYRPVPLSLTFIGLSSRLPEEEGELQQQQLEKESLTSLVNEKMPKKKTDAIQLRQEWMNKLCFEQLQKFLQRQQQVLVFVHSRHDTSRTARAFLQYINKHGLSHLLGDTDEESTNPIKVGQFKSSDLREFVSSNVAIHHAGLLRSDRSYVEELFRQGLLRVVICTATLAWGVNLPAHAVIIKGTQIYDASRGGFTELGLLDVMQIFGRAGRPQFDTEGEAVMITTHQQLPFYLRLLTSQLPIESQLCHLSCLADHLNAEIVLGNISNVMQGVEWLEYTYLATRMRKNPLAYGISWQELLYDPSLMTKKREMIIASAKILDEARMIRFDSLNEVFYSTELGRIASHFYVCNGTVHKWNEMLRADFTDSEVIRALSMADEMETIKFRDDELPELLELSKKCPIRILGALENSKVVILLQSYISRLPIHTSALISDTQFIVQNAGRLAQALFEIVLGRAWPSLSYTILQLCRSLQRRIWPFQHPLRQLAGDGERKKHSSNKHPHISAEICYKLEQLGPSGEFSHLTELGVDELSSALRAPQAAKNVMRCISLVPQLYLEAEAFPLTSTVIQIQLSWKPHFYWNDHLHGILESQERHPESWWLWVEDTETEQIYHSEQISVTKRLAQEYWKHPDKEPQTRNFSIAVYEPISPQYVIRACSAHWHGADTVVAISFYGMQLPRHETVYTNLLDLQPLHRSCLFLGSHLEQVLYPNIRYFNPLQTQVFHVAYHTDENILFAAPTGSGKTAIAEFAMLRCMRTTKERGIMGLPGLIVYIAPLKALVRERAQDWRKRFGDPSLGKVIVELTGDDSPANISTTLKYADIICTTPEKWDSISRSWRRRKQVLEVTLYILDEVHLLGSERGPVLEMIVSRAKRLALKHNIPVRWIALSTALANPVDLASWLGVEDVGMFNFRPSVRPVPCEVHIMGVAGKNYSPRMTAMNKPAYQAIRQYSPHKPVLIFVSSRRQTRRTALEMIRCAASDGNPHFFLKSDISKEFASIEDSSLKSTLEYGLNSFLLPVKFICWLVLQLWLGVSIFLHIWLLSKELNIMMRNRKLM
ncbi:Activating signal cointegrator 1 complex subunit 3 [Galdieria sulphuraria]|nr:Activating signal cointegrator 1 complex subunit 3 [Galdieria sulphuraria]